MLRSRVLCSFTYLECHCSLFRRVRSKTCPWCVATLLVVCSTLERWVLVAATVRRELQGSTDAAIKYASVRMRMQARYIWGSVCVCVCVRARVCVCVRVRVRVRVRARARVCRLLQLLKDQ